jgi:hypothetical protein
MGPGGIVVRPGNSARKAMSDEFASAAILPGASRSEKPVFAELPARRSKRKPVLIRGNKTNKGQRVARFEAEFCLPFLTEAITRW